MSSTELDLPLQPSPDQIRRRQFATMRRGFDPDQVRDYLGQVADHVESLEAQAREARREVEAAERRPAAPAGDPYGELSSRLAELIRAADQQADKLRQGAREEAERVLAEARADADRIRLDAQARAEEARASGDKALRDAKFEADRTLAALSSRRESLVGQLQAMQERLLGVARELEAAIERPAGGDEPAAAGPDVITIDSGGPSADPFVDPRYEDLWASTEAVELAIPDMPPLDLGLDGELEEADEPDDPAT